MVLISSPAYIEAKELLRRLRRDSVEYSDMEIGFYKEELERLDKLLVPATDER